LFGCVTVSGDQLLYEMNRDRRYRRHLSASGWERLMMIGIGIGLAILIVATLWA
jgi:hypothetical protein